MLRKFFRIPFLFVIITTICYQNQPVWSGSIYHHYTSAASSSAAAAEDHHFSSYRDNTIGCLYSDVCNENQVCFDDHAFGRCEEYDPRTGSFSNDYTYQLDRKTFQLLEKELNRLSREGYDWPDPYTQCILKVILNDRPRIVYDPIECDKYISSSSSSSLLLLPPPPSTTATTEDNWFDSDLLEFPTELQTFNELRTSKTNDLSNNLGRTLSKYSKSPSNLDNNDKNKDQNFKKESSKIGNQNLNKESLPLIPLSSSSSPQPSPSTSTSSITSTSFLQQQSQIPSPSSSSKSKVTNGNLAATIDSNNLYSILKTEKQQPHIGLFSLMPKLRERHDLKLSPSILTNDQENKNKKTKKAMENIVKSFKNGQSFLQSNNHVDDISSPSTKTTNSEDLLIQDDSFNIERNKKLVDLLRRLIENSNANLDNDDDIIYNIFMDDVDRLTKNSKKVDINEGEEEHNNYLNNMVTKSSQLNNNGEFYSYNNNKDQSTEFYDTKKEENGDEPQRYFWQRFHDQPASKNPLMSIYKIPEIRVIRDTDEANDDGITNRMDFTLLESPLNDDMVLVDFDESEDINDNNDYNNLDIDYGNSMNLLNQIFNGKLMVIGDDKGNNQQDDEDHDILVNNDDDDMNEKEILLGDINYSNNYIMPNFYRNHRYDIKKPGPIYFEDYFFKPNDNNMDHNQNKQKNVKTLKQEKSNLMKKDFSIRSNQPVAEGPVKLDAKSENTLIIRSAAEGEQTNLEAIDSTHTYVITDKMLGEEDSERFLQTIEQVFNLPRGTFSNIRKEDYQITFKVNPNYLELNASQVASRIEDSAKLIKDITGYMVKETGIGDKAKLPVVSATIMKQSNERLIKITLYVCTIVLSIISAAFVIFMFRRNAKFREKIKGFMKLSEDWIKFDYQDLCRQRFQNKNKNTNNKNVEKSKNLNDSKSCSGLKNVDTKTASQQGVDTQGSPPSRSSTSSWVEEPVSSNMDITTGHIILSYMEDHLKNKDRLDREWEALCAYEADPCSTNAALQKQNSNKNRYPNLLPYDHSRVILNDSANASNSDYINANTITDHDPRNPAYIATQGPLPNTKADFWQMIWEQGSVMIVMLTRLRENGINMCDRYWPEEGSEMFQNYEVHLVSEHIWCDDYLVRSFYLKNLKTGETRTVTQFHFLSWPENGIPPNIKSILDFRRKVNKSYKGRSCPIVAHCSDGVGRTGTYILIDMVLNRLAKGAKEIDIAASLEHIRDQRCAMVKTKAQFEFALLAVADEVQAILKALSN